METDLEDCKACFGTTVKTAQSYIGHGHTLSVLVELEPLQDCAVDSHCCISSRSAEAQEGMGNARHAKSRHSDVAKQVAIMR